MLTFGESFLRGDVPNRDFLHLYGPGGVWVLAGAFEVFGVSLAVERVVGLLQLLGIIGGVFLLAWPWGRKVALTGAVITAFVIIPPIGLTALAWNGGIALGLLGLAATLGAIRATTPRARSWLAILGGVLLGGGAPLPARPRARRRPRRLLPRARGRPTGPRCGCSSSFGAVVCLYFVHFAMAGIGDSIQGMLIDPVFNLRGGRSLPLPPSLDGYDAFLGRLFDDEAISWPIPHLDGPVQLTVWFLLLLASLVALTVVAVRVRRREPTAFRGIVLATVAAFSLGILPQALQRPDPTHLAWVSCVPFGFLPVVAYETVRQRRPTFSPTRAWALGGGAVAIALVLLVPFFLVRDYTDVSLETFDVDRQSNKIENEGRSFYYGNTEAADELDPAAAGRQRDRAAG